MPPYLLIVLASFVAFGAAAVLVLFANSVLNRVLDRLEHVDAADRQVLRERTTRLVGRVRLMAFVLAALASVSFGLARFGITGVAWDVTTAGRWLMTVGVNVVVTLLGASIVLRAGHLAIEHMQQRLATRHGKDDLEWQRRASTLRGILMNLATIVVWFIAILMVLRELSIDIVPLLTGAGIAGLAIGFGAQNMVRDVISGFFIILEDQVRVGDLARINGVTGLIEQIKMRTIVLRDAEGAVQVFPNGTITALANLSKQFTFAVVEVRVLYSENLDRVFATIREVGAAMQAAPAFAPVLLEPIEILGVISIDGGHTTITTRFKTLPLNQGRVANELRRRLLLALAGRGIRPYAT